METLSRTFFEDPLYAYVALAVAELVLAATWYVRRTRGSLAAMLAPPLLAAATFAVERLVVTDRERILAAAGEIARDIERGSLASAEECLDDGFGGYWPTRAIALAAGRAAIAQYRFDRVRVVNPKVEVSGTRAAMHAMTIVSISAGEAAGNRVCLVWDILWIKRPAGWRIFRMVNVQAGTELM